MGFSGVGLFFEGAALSAESTTTHLLCKQLGALNAAYQTPISRTWGLKGV
jgi:hypothetical protein